MSCVDLSTNRMEYLYIHAVVKFAFGSWGVCTPGVLAVHPMFVASALARVAVSSPQRQAAWGGVDTNFRKELEVYELNDPLVWAGLRGDRDQLLAMLKAMGLMNFKDDENMARLETALRLQAAARGVGEDWTNQMARVRPLDLAVEQDRMEKRAKVSEDAQTLERLRVEHAHSKPAVWRGVAYRRAEAIGDDKARKRAEEKDREKWARKTVRVLTSADLPFGKEILANGWDALSPEASRCLRGLRAASLRKKYSDIAPLLRFLETELGKKCPEDKQDVLSFYRIRFEGGAARTSYGSLLAAIHFYEEAGDRAPGARLAKSSALVGAAKEYEARRRKQSEEAGEAVGTRQAPPLVLAVLAAIEGDVLNEEHPLYFRAYAAYRLLRHWGRLRFDDTSGLSPAAMERRVRGWFGLLRRTKTSGADKAVSALPAFISNDAWISEDWLSTGMALWQETSLGYARDYWLVLPCKDFSGTCGKRARYTDARMFSKALLSGLKGRDGQRLLEPEAVDFWSEHSDRTGLDSWLAALSVGPDLRRFVGRWGAQGSEDRYVRTSVRITENCQRLAAHHGRAAFNGGADFFGEEETLAQLSNYLAAKGVEEARVAKQMARLKVAKIAAPPDALGSLSVCGGLVLRNTAGA